jgi:nucleotide-binding universal stress UspA family protein
MIVEPGGMTVKKRIYVPLLTYPDTSREALVDNAVELARNLDAVLCATIVDVSIPPITNPWPVFLDTDDMVQRAERKSRQEGETLARVLEKRCGEADVASEIRSITVTQPDVFDVLTEEARFHDVVLAQSAAQFAAFAEALIFGAGRPVILYPDRPCAGRIDNVAIAWDGSRAAAGAVGDAGSFLETASKVSIISVVDEKLIDKNAATNLAAKFALSGVATDVHIVEALGRSIGHAIQFKAVELRVDLLVMGGFGHSRLREFVLGGATSDVLSNAMLPVLMSH